MGDFGLESRTDDAGNLVAPIVYSKNLPYVAVSAHLDTTLAPRQAEDVFVNGDGSFHGPGVTDNGAGLAALVAIARVLRAGRLVEKPRRNVLLIANVAGRRRQPPRNEVSVYALALRFTDRGMFGD